VGLDIAESDWKVFKILHPIAMDRFFERAVKEMQPLLWTKNKPAQERFWDALNLAEKQRQQAARLFDDYRRSTAVLQAGLWYANDLLTEEESSRFSPEMQQRLRALAKLGSS
jgi:hypothetical protein